MMLIATGRPAAVTIGMIVALNVGVLGPFAMECVTMPELFGARTRFTQLGVAKEVGAILTTAAGPVVAASLTAVTGSWWPVAAMLVVYSLVTFVSALFAPETRGRDLVSLEDAL
jgi:MHS family metabolite:H+ symporter-like MFS transporter